MPDDTNTSPTTTNSPSPSTLEPTLSATVVRVAWMAVLLGLAMEVLLLILTAGFGFFPGLKSFIADLVRQVSWSVFVCIGLALGTVASRMRTQLMGLLGLLGAPLAFNAARVVHQGVSKALQIVGPAPESSSLLLYISVLKGVEYALLGIAIGWIGRRVWGGFAAHVGTGLVVGIVFGSLIIALTYWEASSALSGLDLISRGVNEVLFPVGCSVVLYSAKVVGKKSEE
jgi:hypothetical protein